MTYLQSQNGWLRSTLHVHAAHAAGTATGTEAYAAN